MLYVVATPLGNKRDITRRALDVLADCDEWVVEDTREAGKLRDLLDLPKKPMTSYYDEVEAAKTEQIVEKLKRGRDLALLSDAGTPQVADPGYNLLEAVHRADLKVCPIPGPSAPITALSVSGFPSDQFISLGFIPKKSKAKRDVLLSVKYFSGTTIFFESPNRIVATLRLVGNLLGNRLVFLGREMTKKFEEYSRAPINELIERWEEKDPRGEFTVLIHPGPEETVEPEEYLRDLLRKGLKLSDAAKISAKFSSQPKSELYKLGLELQEAENL